MEWLNLNSLEPTHKFDLLMQGSSYIPKIVSSLYILSGFDSLPSSIR